MNEPIVVVPTWNREELLYLCLEAIRRESPSITIRVYSDRGAVSNDLTRTTNEFDATLIIRAPHGFYGNSFNVIEAASDAAYIHRASIVHMIEDDTILHGGYLKWAEEQLASGEYAAVCGRIPCPNLKYWYDSPCASWTNECLKWAISMKPKSYFHDTREAMVKALDAEFPRSVYRGGGGEQDGFFLRCIEKHKWTTAFPPKPLASHLGAWGYNRGGAKRPEGIFEERIEFCRNLLRDRGKRIALFGMDITTKEMGGMIP